MQTKDILTVIISTLALTLSIFSILQKRAETERGLRVRLSELVDELNAITVENAKLPTDEPIDPRILSALNGRRELLARQAFDLIERFHGDVTEQELATIANAFARTGDVERAGLFWDRAVASSSSTNSRLIVLRGYGAYLFDTGKADKARSQYSAALDLVQADDNISLWTRGETLLRWGTNEAYLPSGTSNPDEVIRLLGAAREAFERINFRPRRLQGLRRIRDAIEDIRDADVRLPATIEEGLDEIDEELETTVDLTDIQRRQ